MEKFKTVLKGHVEAVEFLTGLSDKLDKEAMMKIANVNKSSCFYVVVDGKKYACNGAKRLSAIANHFCNTKFLQHECYDIGKKFVMFATEDYNNKEATKEIKDTEKETEDAKPVVDVPKALDLTVVEALYDAKNKRASKKALDEYAKETFGIDLNGSQKFEDMVEELKEAVANKE